MEVISMPDWLQVGINIILLIITLASTYYAKKTVQVAKEQIKLISNPVIGIEVKEIGISETFSKKDKRRNMWVEVEVANIGNDPAIDILIDGEIELEYANIENETVIPARFTPGQKSFLMSGEKFSDIGSDLDFGNTFIEHFLKSSRIAHKMNKERIKNTPWENAHKTAKLIVYAYYSNNLGQYFKSKYIIYIHLSGKIPKVNESAIIDKIYIPRPVFSNNIISKVDMEKEIAKRDEKRDLCGW